MARRQRNSGLFPLSSLAIRDLHIDLINTGLLPKKVTAATSGTPRIEHAMQWALWLAPTDIVKPCLTSCSTMSRSLLLSITLLALLAMQTNAYVTIGRHKAGGTRISKHRGLAAASDCAALCESTASCTHASSTRRRTETTWTCSLLSAMSRMTASPRAVVYVMESTAASRMYQKFLGNTLEIAAPFSRRRLRKLDACKNACDLDSNCDAVSQKGKYCYFHDIDETPKAMQRYPVWVAVTGGCMNSQATNYNSDAVMDDGSCTFPAGMGCGNSHAVNYDSAVVTHNEASCEFPTAGCMDSMATNYNPMVTVDDGSCTLPPGMGCGNMDALNYDSAVVTHNEAMCEFPPEFVLTPYPGKKYGGGVFVRRVNGQNRAKCQQLCMRMGDECHGINSIGSKCFVYSTNHHEQGSIASNSRVNYYAKERVGCTNSTALNFNPAAQAELDPSTCRFDGVGSLSGGGSSGSSGSSSSSANVMTGEYYGIGDKRAMGLAHRSDLNAGEFYTPQAIPELNGATKVLGGQQFILYLLPSGELKCTGKCRVAFNVPTSGGSMFTARRRLQTSVFYDTNVYTNMTVATAGPVKDFWFGSNKLITLGTDDNLYIYSTRCEWHRCGHDNMCAWDYNHVPEIPAGDDPTACTAAPTTPFSAISTNFPTTKTLKDFQFAYGGIFAHFTDGSVWYTGTDFTLGFGEAWTEKLPAGVNQLFTSRDSMSGGYFFMDDGTLLAHGENTDGFGLGSGFGRLSTITQVPIAFSGPVKKLDFVHIMLMILYVDGSVEKIDRLTNTVLTAPRSDYVNVLASTMECYMIRSDGTVDCMKDAYVAECVAPNVVSNVIPSQGQLALFSA